MQRPPHPEKIKMISWHPNVNIETLKLRAALLNTARRFFQSYGFIEVDTPSLSQSTTPDPNIESFSTSFNNTRYYLHTSPEFPMKRLLAAGSGAIYQICKVFRQGEAGRNHNPEFTLIEWYQPEMHYRDLMTQVDSLVRDLLKDKLELKETIFYSYQDVFENIAGINPLFSNEKELHAVIEENNIQLYDSNIKLSKDALLDLIITQVIQPNLPTDVPVFIYDYPATQAALANIRKGKVDIAERFELYINGIELANGYQELLDAKEQQQRFKNENKVREQIGLQIIPIDANLISALDSGLPMVSGVALGLDRVLMLAAGVDSISDVIAFTIDRA